MDIFETHLSYVDHYAYEMGTATAEMLFNRIMSDETEYIPKINVLYADLIIRGSSLKE